MRPALRLLMATFTIVAASVVPAQPVLASCAPLPPLPELAASVDAVVYGRVTGFEGRPGGGAGRFAFVKVERVLKGSAYADIGIALGPAADAPPGTVAATSVDYNVERGSDHTFYLRQRAPGGYETNACIGNHAGPPTPDEERFFGAGKPPDRSPTGIDATTSEDRAIAAAATLLAAVLGAGAIAYALRSRRPAAG